MRSLWFLICTAEVRTKKIQYARRKIADTINSFVLERYLYLGLNFASFIVPFLCSFYPRAPFRKKWKWTIPAILFTAIVFIVWDALFTLQGVWGFNPQYLIGISILGLPLEELLFFFCIPYACLFTYFSLYNLVKSDAVFPYRITISWVLGLALILIGVWNFDRLYTSVTFVSTGTVVLWLGVKQRASWLGRFYAAFAILLIPFFLVNGALTGLFTPEPVVWYNNSENLGLRITTIPAEDIVYALLMLIIPVALWERWESRDQRPPTERDATRTAVNSPD